MAHDTGGRVVPQNAFDPFGRSIGAVTDDDHAGMLGKTHADAAAVMQAETQVAPEAVFSSAFSSGQSETASDPSFMDSVSRLGLATDPESR